MSKSYGKELQFHSNPDELDKAVNSAHRRYKHANKKRPSKKELRRQRTQERLTKKNQQPLQNIFKFKILKDESREINGKRIYRIVALRDIFDSKGNLVVKKGTKGGWISNFKSLSQTDGCWVHPLGEVLENARVTGDAQLFNGVITDKVWLRASASIKSGEVITGQKTIHY